MIQYMSLNTSPNLCTPEKKDHLYILNDLFLHNVARLLNRWPEIHSETVEKETVSLYSILTARNLRLIQKSVLL